MSNFGTLVTPPIVGSIHDNTSKSHGYFYVEVFFISISLIVVALLIVV